ncbi:thioredoxin domain-containing protein [Novosphingobium sp.]|uniref:thioredoxin domain-containing protein n=1 Tax=Novosphingobium sp. TaxID=1874826 RepID=UPI0038BA5C47
MLKVLTTIIAALAGVGLLTAAAPARKPLAPKPAARVVASGGWGAKVTRTPQDSYILGNPAAPVRLITYISYTCPHCAEFDKESEVPLKVGMIDTGKGALEVRPFLRNAIDVVATLLAECGPPEKFLGNHLMLLRRQDEWTAPAMSMNEVQKARWSNPDFATRMRAIASDLKLYDLMEARGYGRPELDRCLADRALAERATRHTQDAVEKDFVRGTPAFVLNGVPLAGTANWAGLKPQLEARLH